MLENRESQSTSSYCVGCPRVNIALTGMALFLPWVLCATVASMPKSVHEQFALIQRMSTELHAKDLR